MKKDKHRWEDVDVCIRCDEMMPTPKGNGIRWAVCKKCAEEMRSSLEHWKKYGLYATNKGAK